MREKGATLIELAIALGVVGILIAATAFAYQGWMEKYKVEKATSELYTDLMRARLLAIQTNRKHFAVLNDFSYSLIEDTNDTGIPDNGDRLLPTFPKPLEHRLRWNNTGNEVAIDKRGTISQGRKIWFASSSGPDYDCMKISQSRIVMGRYKSSTGECIPK